MLIVAIVLRSSSQLFRESRRLSRFPLCLHEFTGYNDRLQPEDLRLGTAQDASDVWRAELSYDPLGGACLTQGGMKNNGNISWQRITAPRQAGGTLTLCQTYGYDEVNRLTAAAETVVGGPASWSRTNAYDAFGNRAVNGTDVGQFAPKSLTEFSTATNRIAAVPGAANPMYDAAGNLTSHPGVGTLAYDAENRQTLFSGGGKTAQYVYDGEGRRVKRTTTGIGGGTTWYVYDAFGKLAAEYTPTGPAGAAGAQYRTVDHLGSTRVVTNEQAAVVAGRDYFPFGERISDARGSRGTVGGYAGNLGFTQGFTAKERDDESGLDYFLARYYAGSLGRFTSPDAPFDRSDAERCPELEPLQLRPQQSAALCRSNGAEVRDHRRRSGSR